VEIALPRSRAQLSTVGLVALATAVHLAVGLALLPQWMFASTRSRALLVQGRLQLRKARTSARSTSSSTSRHRRGRPCAVHPRRAHRPAGVPRRPPALRLAAGWVALVLAAAAALMLYEATLEPDLLILVANPAR
jgi:hypothetical protein